MFGGQEESTLLMFSGETGPVSGWHVYPAVPPWGVLDQSPCYQKPCKPRRYPEVSPLPL